MTDVNKTLEERGARYGSFEDHAVISQGLLDAIRKLPAWEKLEPDMRQAISTIFDKIARIMNGDPYYTDNWHDIQGYARLVEARLLKLEEEQKARLFEEPAEAPDANWVEPHSWDEGRGD